MRKALYLYNNFTDLANRKWPTYFTLGLILFSRHKTIKYFKNNGPFFKANTTFYIWPPYLWLTQNDKNTLIMAFMADTLSHILFTHYFCIFTPAVHLEYNYFLLHTLNIDDRDIFVLLIYNILSSN